MIPIYETFHAFQGEGYHMGKNAYFIRSHGCHVRCSFCDSAGTWHQKFMPKNVAKLSDKDIAESILIQPAKIVIITGGEPTLHKWQKVLDLVKKVPENSSKANKAPKSAKKIHLETCGNLEFFEDFDWVTLSPKKEAPPCARSLRVCNELKLIATGVDFLNEWKSVINEVGDIPIWLHPEWSLRSNPSVLRAITDAVKYGDPRFRAGYQLHKLYSCDSLDKRSRPLVPLGGVEENGY